MKKSTQLHTLYLGSLALLLLAGQSAAFAQRDRGREQDHSSDQQRGAGNQRSAEVRQSFPQRSSGNQGPADIRQSTPQRSAGNQRPADVRIDRPQRTFDNQPPADRRRESPQRIETNQPQRVQIGDRNGAASANRNQSNSPQRSYSNMGSNDAQRNTSFNRPSLSPQRQNNDNRNNDNRFNGRSDNRYDNRNNDNRYNNSRSENRYDNRNRDNDRYRPVYGNSYRPRYSRAPMVWEGRRYYSMYNYTYHPYRPFYYGSYFHPIGFFTASLQLGALSIFWDNRDYRYYDGAYYQPYNNGYRVVAPPDGAGIPYLPNGYSTLVLGSDTFYYFGGIFYYHDGNSYIITQAPPGAVVYDLPEGCTDVVVGNISYLQYNNTLFQPIVLNGRNAYEVVELEDGNQ